MTPGEVVGGVFVNIQRNVFEEPYRELVLETTTAPSIVSVTGGVLKPFPITGTSLGCGVVSLTIVPPWPKVPPVPAWRAR